MTRQSRMTATLNHATETATLCDNALPGVLAVIAAELGAVHLKAQSFDGIRVSGFTTETDDDGHPMPVRSDPVGRQVAEAVDSQKVVLAEIEAKINELRRTGDELLALLQPWQATGRRLTTPTSVLAAEAKEAALEEARSERENEPCCRSCARIEQRSEVLYRREVDGDVVGLCRWCYDFHRSVGILPSREELAEHHAGGKVRRRVAP